MKARREGQFTSVLLFHTKRINSSHVFHPIAPDPRIAISLTPRGRVTCGSAILDRSAALCFAPATDPDQGVDPNSIHYHRQDYQGNPGYAELLAHRLAPFAEIAPTHLRAGLYAVRRTS